MAALATTAPAGSATVPVMVPRSLCANVGTDRPKRNTARLNLRIDPPEDSFVTIRLCVPAVKPRVGLDRAGWWRLTKHSSVSFRLRPASINRRVRVEATSVELPELDDARTET